MKKSRSNMNLILMIVCKYSCKSYALRLIAVLKDTAAQAV